MIAELTLAATAGGIVGHGLDRWVDRLARGGHAGAPVLCASRPAISARALELVTAALCALAWWQYGLGPLFVSRTLFGCALILLFTVDLQRHQLPNVVTLPGIAMGIGFSFVTEPGWFASLVGTVAGGGILCIMSEVSHRLRGESGVGMGDVKMLAMIGAFIGWKLMLAALVVALLSGSMTSIALMATRRGAAPRLLPFGTFLAAGAAVAMAAEPMLIGWYWRLF